MNTVEPRWPSLDEQAPPVDPIVVATAVERHLARLGHSLPITEDNSDAILVASANLVRAFAGLRAPTPYRPAGPVAEGEPDGMDDNVAVGVALAAIEAYGGPRVDRTKARRLLSEWRHHPEMSGRERIGTIRRFPTKNRLNGDPFAVRECEA